MLYIEDNPSNLLLVQLILDNRPDIQLLSATDAEEGIDLAREHRPDLILTDIHLPGMDGVTAFKELLSYEETKDIPVIAVSANVMESDIQRTMREGFRDYIIKPIDIADFLQKVDQALATGRQPPNP